MPGGEKISEEARQAFKTTVIRRNVVDARLRDARGLCECAHEWRVVSYVVHVRTRLNAKAAGTVLFDIPAVDRPSCRMNRADSDEMRALPNISTTVS